MLSAKESNGKFYIREGQDPWLQLEDGRQEKGKQLRGSCNLPGKGDGGQDLGSRGRGEK